MFRHTNDPEDRFQVGWVTSPPAVGMDVSDLQATGQPAAFKGSVTGYPVDSLKYLPPGDYFVQALLNYTERVPPRRWTCGLGPHGPLGGEKLRFIPRKSVQCGAKAHLEAGGHEKFKLQLIQVVPPVQVPADTV